MQLGLLTRVVMRTVASRATVLTLLFPLKRVTSCELRFLDELFNEIQQPGRIVPRSLCNAECVLHKL